MQVPEGFKPRSPELAQLKASQEVSDVKLELQALPWYLLME
jgi:hypothetical protein